MAQILFGRFFWVWIVGFLASATYLGGISIQQLMRLSNPKAYKIPKGKSLLSKGEQQLRLSVILKGHNLFDPNGGFVTQPKTPTTSTKKVEKVKTPTKIKSKVPGCPPIQAGTKIPKSKLRRVRLKGISYTEEDPLQSVAAIYVKVKLSASSPPARRKRKRYRRRRRRRKRRRRYKRRHRRSSSRTRWQTEIFRVGEMLMGKARICAIRPKEIIIYNNRRLEKFALIDKKRKRKISSFGSFGIAKKSDNKGPGQVRIDAIDKRTISRSTIQDWIKNPMAHAMSARIMPMPQKNGRSQGLRLVWVRKKSLYSQLGLTTGDVVQSINGKTLNIGNALGLYSQLPFAKKLKVNIVRKGVRRQLFFNVK